jgi:hypothetical protein
MYNFVGVSAGIILKVLRLEVSVHNVYITNHLVTAFAQGRGRGEKKTFKIFVPSMSTNSASAILQHIVA